jgi:glutathione S-transferase
MRLVRPDHAAQAPAAETLTLVGHFQSPYVRRVAVSLHLLGIGFTLETREPLAQPEALRSRNPVGRVPALVLPCGDVIIDSAAILDWADEQVGPARALIPPRGAERRRAFRLIALATGAIDRIGAANLERRIRPEPYRWPERITRSLTLGKAAIEACAAEAWPDDAPLDQAAITTACMVAYVRGSAPDCWPEGAYPTLEALGDRCEALDVFAAAR